MAVSELPRFPKSILENELDPIDIYILNKLNDKTYGWERRDLSSEERKFLDEYKMKPWKREGAAISTLADEMNKELGTDLTRRDVESRVERMASKGVVKFLHAIIIDPTKIYDHVFHTYIKFPIAHPLRARGWWDIGEIWDIDKKEKDEEGRELDMIRLLGIIEGTGEYDAILMMYTNDLTQYSSMLRKLRDKGFIEKSMTQRIWPPTGLKFDPVKIPDYDYYLAAFNQHYKRINEMYKEISSGTRKVKVEK